MHRQLAAIVEDLESAQARLRQMHGSFSDSDWQCRHSSDAWSPANCVSHLNMTTRALLPILRGGLEGARECRRDPVRRYRRNVMGWLVWSVLSPSSRWKTATIPAFEPVEPHTAGQIVMEFERLQAELIALVRQADELPIDRVTLRSPFDARLRFNLCAALTIVARHQHRHLVQATRTVRISAPPAATALAV